MKLRVFRSLFGLLFIVILATIYFINPEMMSWTFFFTAVIIYSVLDLAISFIIGRNRSEDDDYESSGY
ncbi:hypothetical protein [Salinicoccus sp. YB14-2]|uniref:hypothetical protein n=1 Tax=Salinicoccus sp. YB14-2 TaxID=1572701 RepID=UPI00068E90C4|nr:hypothetical protein [Salinicoccus sp. YB14-2]